jgi:hypothetical protein
MTARPIVSMKKLTEAHEALQAAVDMFHTMTTPTPPPAPEIIHRAGPAGPRLWVGSSPGSSAWPPRLAWQGGLDGCEPPVTASR